jgi:ribosomal-protein-alanine N-acetyltransferase
LSASTLPYISRAGRRSTLARLADARRVFDRLDWWTVDQWAGSPTLHIQDDAALLIVPPDLTPSQELAAARNPSAWVRWCAVSDGTSASPLVPRLLNEAHEALQQAGVTDAWAIVHPQDWLLSYLQDAGYVTIDRMLTYEAAPADIAAPPAHGSLSLRPLRAHELALAHDLDTRSFEPPWRYPPVIMHKAYGACAVFTLAEWEGKPAGYCCALLNDAHGHVVRLAIDPQHRRAGIGTAMLAQVVHVLGEHGATSVSLNTQGDNHVSQRLYLRMGFNEIMERPMVLRKVLNVPGGGRTEA